MIQFYRHKLDNGLQVIVYPDYSTPMAAVDVCYHVGAKHEDPNRTGFAHLFEHLMFGGSKHIPDYDLPLQRAGGENNAYTTNDLTNYYLTIPKANLETGFWLESDRMLELDFSEDSLNVQRNVVIEEFKQRNLNQPYGDVWALIRELAYRVHPYNWPTIGKEINHIADASLDDVKSFFYRFYAPDNAVLVLSGNVDIDESLRLAEKWFGQIPNRKVQKPALPVEPVQTAFREKTVERPVPDTALYLAFHMDDRKSREYYICDIISDVLSNGNSSRLYQKLVKEERLFVELDAYISGDHDPGLFLVSGKLAQQVSIEKAQKAVWQELHKLQNQLVPTAELEKVKNKIEANHVYSQMNYLNMAQELATFENIGKAELINEQLDIYRSVTPADLMQTAQKLFHPENCSQLNYLAKS
ncbi:M16 family metallopeptidase [Gaoshiqia sediminis]|uniref:Insulinase family protein n=1 Tax=Gaoshiqia sediminis TaxID=2986998 RepID=A0AA41Y518_9BACT|nr:pitrilysin family protein [Gaoshiqia sediminis]MCW0481980.1 insulinase family protein [Gaoshiqia sediminis]